MSHIVEAKTKITYPNLHEFLYLSRQKGAPGVADLPFLALLRQAVTMVAQEHAGELKSYYLDYARNQHEVNTGLALHIPRRVGKPRNEAIERGLGLAIDEHTGVLTFVGDPYGVQPFYEAVQRQIVQKYAALAYMAAMRRKQYQKVTTRSVEQSLIVSGEIYA